MAQPSQECVACVLLLAQAVSVSPWPLDWGFPKVTHSLLQSFSEARLPNSKPRRASSLTHTQLCRTQRPSPAFIRGQLLTWPVSLLSEPLTLHSLARVNVALEATFASWDKAQAPRNDSAALRSQKI